MNAVPVWHRTKVDSCLPYAIAVVARGGVSEKLAFAMKQTAPAARSDHGTRSRNSRTALRSVEPHEKTW